MRKIFLLFALVSGALIPARSFAITPVSVAVGDSHSCALFDNGSVKCWGDNSTGQLGTGTTSDHGGSPSSMGASLPFVNLGTNRRAVEIRANGLNTCALLDDATLKCWGSNDLGQLGQGNTFSRGRSAQSMGDGLKPIDLRAGRKVISFAVGFAHVCAILDNQELKCWGKNSHGELGMGDGATRGNRNDQMGEALLPVQLGVGRHAVQISAGYSHTCALLDNGATKCWGENTFGQLGQGDSNLRGGTPSTIGDRISPIAFNVSTRVKKVFAGSDHSCAFFEDSSIRCWGGGAYGQLGTGRDENLGDDPGEMGGIRSIDLEPGLPVGNLDCGRRHCCAQFIPIGTMKCWGINSDGQLGLGDIVDRGEAPDQMGVHLPFVDLGTLESIKSVVTGRYHSCAIIESGSVKCWGLNGDGQLGLGDTRNRGARSGDMGDRLPRVLVL